MYVVRPQAILSTPRQLAHDLGWQTRRYPNERLRRPFDYNRDFFMCPVRPEHVVNAVADYGHAFSFYVRDKYAQRIRLQDSGIPVPRVASRPEETANLGSEKFVVRPLRHSGGMGYRVTDNKLDFTPGTEYISELYPKQREYRVIFVFGKPLIYLRKKPNEGVENDQPWGHVNSFFQTINDVPSSLLAATDCVARLEQMAVVRGSHIVAADVLFNRHHQQPYVVLELNACPALTLDNNRAKVVEAIKGRQ